MKAIVVRRFGTTPDMAVEERPIPVRKPGQALVRVRAATISPYNNAVRTGAFGPDYAKAPLVLGVEGAGVVEEGERFAPGTRVAVYGGAELGTSTDGLFQQWVAVDEDHLVVIPDSLDWAEGSALTLNYLTAHLALTKSTRVEAGQTVLIAGATGSVGHASIQTANELGARPVAVVSSPAKALRAEQAGAWAVIDRSTSNLADEVARLTDGAGVDVALDPVGGSLLGELLRTLRPHGTLVSIGFSGGMRAELQVMDLIGPETTITGVDVFLHSIAAIAPALRGMGKLAANGTLRPIIDSRFPFADFEAAYTRLASREAIGSIVIEL
ncbi:zinc-binding alcohol dehydrogenase family protein [Streptomyces sp. NPDC026672]|uniref:quinone oxidoreductase family protein n=1 Tax=unclassified Streptomyces TaxID=2593676 RepID=UPI0033E3AF7B